MSDSSRYGALLLLAVAHCAASAGATVGTAHEWQTWRRDLVDFAPRLFR